MVEWAELGVFCSVIGGLVISLCITIQKSHCSNVSLCWGLINCVRVVPKNEDKEDEENKLNNKI